MLHFILISLLLASNMNALKDDQGCIMRDYQSYEKACAVCVNSLLVGNDCQPLKINQKIKDCLLYHPQVNSQQASCQLCKWGMFPDAIRSGMLTLIERNIASIESNCFMDYGKLTELTLTGNILSSIGNILLCIMVK